MGFRQGVLIALGIVAGLCAVGTLVVSLFFGGCALIGREVAKEAPAEVERIQARTRQKEEEGKRLDEELARLKAENAEINRRNGR